MSEEPRRRYGFSPMFRRRAAAADFTIYVIRRYALPQASRNRSARIRRKA